MFFMASLSFPTSPKPLQTSRYQIKCQKSTQLLSGIPNISTDYHQKITSLCKDGSLDKAFSLLNEMELNRIPVGPEIYGELLQGCVYERAYHQGQQIHSRIIKNGAYFYKNEYIETKIFIFYAKCDCLSIAQELFVKQNRPPNIFSWAAFIGLHSRLGLNEKALLFFCKMIEMGGIPDNFITPNALKACSALQLLNFGKCIHGYVLKIRSDSCVFVSSSLVDFYGKCGVMNDAIKVFDEMQERNVVTWNSMLAGFVQNSLDEKALELFYDMISDGFTPTRASIATFLSACANLQAVDEGRQAHGFAILLGLKLDNILGTSIINFYCKVGLVENAEIVFKLMVDRDAVTWNLLISSYVQDGRIDKALYMCHKMKMEDIKFDSVTLSLILSASTYATMFNLGKICHAFCIRNNLESDITVASSIIEFYATCNRIEYAQKIFDYTSSRDLVLWNTLISAYAQHGLSGESLKSFYQMQLEGVPPNVISWNSVILGFLQNGQVDEAQDMFSQMQMNGMNPNFVTWVIFIFGLIQNGCENEAIQFFMQMQSNGFKPSPISIAGVLLACSNIMCLRYGKSVHGHVIRHGFVSYFSIETALIVMYSNCGNMKLANKIFELVSNKDIYLYSTMICALSYHGYAERAISLYKHMCRLGMVPDGVTFTSLLSACTHAHYIDEGLDVFMDMVGKYHITPQKDDYDCLVYFLACCSNFEESLKVVSEMYLIRDESHILEPILKIFKQHQDSRIRGSLLSCMLESEPENLVNYITISSVQEILSKWQRASTLRSLVNRIGVTNKECSRIRIRNGLHEFSVDDISHPGIDRIYETLLCLHSQMESVGCSWIIESNRYTDAKQETLCS